MKRAINTVLLAVMLIFAGCNKYDDTRIWSDLADVGSIVKELEGVVDDLNSQMTALSTIMQSKYITTISKDDKGNPVISYTKPDGTSGTMILATQSDVVTKPVIGVAQYPDGGEWCWRQTTDNGATWEWIYSDDDDEEPVPMPVKTSTPDVGVDADGYWTVNGKPLTDDKNKKILANDVSNILFKSVTKNDETGEVIFTLSDGSEYCMSFFKALDITFDAPIYNSVPDTQTKVKVKYELSGSDTTGAIVDVFASYNVTATIIPGIRTITVAMDGTAEEGNILVMAHCNGSTVLKPLFFTFGQAEIQEPTYNGSVGDIILRGDFTQFEVGVSSNIDYVVNVEDTAKSWLSFVSSRAYTSKTYTFSVGSYENATGEIRTGRISFYNELYDIAALIVVKQSPNIPEGVEAGGIASANDLLAFAAAVNAGTTTERWQNAEGAVVLLKDIDMSEVSSWTPIGDISSDGEPRNYGYLTINPFKGTFDGQGYAIKGLRYTADVGDERYGYGLFGALEGATVRNLILGDADTAINWTFTGTAKQYVCVGALAAYAVDSTIEGVRNYYNIDFTGEDNAKTIFLSGMVGLTKNTVVGGNSKAKGCTNNGFVHTSFVTNMDAGAAGIQTAGIVATMAKCNSAADNVIKNCVNKGEISCPTGRTGGIVASIMGGTVDKCTNSGFITDNHLVGQTGLSNTTKRMGGIFGGSDEGTAVVNGCTNEGNVFSATGCRCGGFAGHSKLPITGCENKGIILGDGIGGNHGPGWACGFAQENAKDGSYINVKDCVMGGKVGLYSDYKDNPESAPDATVNNAFGYAPSRFDASLNVVN